MDENDFSIWIYIVLLAVLCVVIGWAAGVGNTTSAFKEKLNYGLTPIVVDDKIKWENRKE